MCGAVTLFLVDFMTFLLQKNSEGIIFFTVDYTKPFFINDINHTIIEILIELFIPHQNLLIY
jgi:hypothetical protein